MAEQNNNLWAPWRMEYLESLDAPCSPESCFLCDSWRRPADDRKNLVVWRGDGVFVLLNRFPYTNGHLLIAPCEHLGDPVRMESSRWTQLTVVTRDVVALLRETVNAQGFNVGMNLGRCAGAGLPDHLHAHVVPRWNGDTNYMAIVGDVRVIPQALEALQEKLSANIAKLGLFQ